MDYWKLEGQVQSSSRKTVNKDGSKVFLYEALLMIRASWNNVTPETVKNCWRKSGLVGVPDSGNYTDNVLSPAEEELQAFEKMHPVAEIGLNTLITQLKATKEEESMQDETDIGAEEKILDAVPTATDCLEYFRMIRNRFMASDKPIWFVLWLTQF